MTPGIFIASEKSISESEILLNFEVYDKQNFFRNYIEEKTGVRPTPLDIYGYDGWDLWDAEERRGINYAKIGLQLFRKFAHVTAAVYSKIIFDFFEPILHHMKLLLQKNTGPWRLGFSDFKVFIYEIWRQGIGNVHNDFRFWSLK